MTAVDTDFAHFIERIKHRTGIDLSLYKESQMLRRLQHLRMRRGFSTFRAYEQALAREPLLHDEFLDHITINVSEFFRNPALWDTLQKKVLVDIAQQTRSIKCWSAACSTGEEPYSLSMQMMATSTFRSVDILASDIDDGALQKAREGHYRPDFLKNVPESVLKRYFKSTDARYTVSAEVKKNVRFVKHNLLADPFERDFHLIMCRNVIIYFTDEAKDQLMHRFSQSLRPGGYLFLGGTEHIKQPGKYQLESVETFFYRKRD